MATSTMRGVVAMIEILIVIEIELELQ